MTAKEKLYKKARARVLKLMEKGCSLTAARTDAAVYSGLSYNTVIRITLDIKSQPKSK